MDFAKIWTAATALFALCATGSARAAVDIDFIVKVPASTPVGESVYLTGNARELCDWNPSCLPMERIYAHTYRARVRLESGPRELEYKVTRGSWRTEASTPAGGAPENTRVQLVGEAQQIVHTVVNWVDQPRLGVMGALRLWSDFPAPELGGARNVRIWLPPQYASEPSRRFPVLYMHDGQNVFDPATSTGGVDWAVDETMTRLSATDPSLAAIVVAVDSGPDRYAEYDYLAKGADYARFLIERLKPEVDRAFRTLPGRESTFTMGSSMGALISLGLVWHHPEVFSAAGAVSLPVWIRENLGFRIIEAGPKPTLPVRIYMDHGDWGGDAIYEPSARELYRRLQDMGFGADSLRYEVVPFADHREADWARRVSEPLQWMLGG